MGENKFAPEIGFINTDYFYYPVNITDKTEIKVKNSLLVFFVLTVLQICFLIYFLFFSEHKSGFYFFIIFVLICLLVFSIYKVIDRSSQIIINRVGIIIKNKGFLKWEEISQTMIKYEILEDSETSLTTYYLVVVGDGVKLESDLTGLTYNYKQIANVIENFKRR